MLSRVAERMYWFGRYIERAENTARLISVNTNLTLDLTRVGYIWSSLISITGFEEAFARRFSQKEERNVVRFLLDDPSGSIRHSIAQARENVRTTREILPSESWENVNELFLFIGENIDMGVRRDGRHRFLAQIMRRCQTLTGYLAGAMSHNDAYNFIKIGRNLERADMTTRILDVGCLNLVSERRPEFVEYEHILWMNVLRSLTALQMYRQNVKDRINGEDVAEYLMDDLYFPRAVAHCLREVQGCFEILPNAEAPLRSLTHAQRRLTSEDVKLLLRDGGLHRFIDELQAELGDIHASIAATWFGSTPAQS
jgi:uncharacterized alpha-E superfamily protein